MNKKIIIGLMIGLFLATLVIAQTVRIINVDLERPTRDFIKERFVNLTLGTAECREEQDTFCTLETNETDSVCTDYTFFSCSTPLYERINGTLKQIDTIEFIRRNTTAQSQRVQQEALEKWMLWYYKSENPTEIIRTPDIEGGDVVINLRR